MGLFGRKGTQPSQGGPSGGPEDQKNQPGHQAVLRHLREKEKEEPGVREQLAGRIIFDFAYELMKDERGVRIENILAMLASVGGQQCVAPVFDAIPPDGLPENFGITAMKGDDGRLYLFGDRINRLLVESPDSLISLAFGAAQAFGAAVTMDMILEEMKKVASRAGKPDFEMLDLPERNKVDRPTEWVRVFTPKIVEALDLYDVPPLRRATAIGYALYRTIEAGKDNLDPLLQAQIVLQCATRTSKIYLG